MEKPNRLGTRHTEETKKILSEKHKGKTHSKESNESRSKKLTGKNNHNYGKRWWNDGNGNEVFSIDCPQNWIPGRNEEAKKISTETNIGRKWWNDGNGNTKFCRECPGNGWVPGVSEERRKNISKSMKNLSKKT